MSAATLRSVCGSPACSVVCTRAAPCYAHGMSRCAALFVDPKSVYHTMPGVDCWGLPARDARFYDGSLPVIAHPPCEVWGCLAKQRVTLGKISRIGDDGGCWFSALAAVTRCGGIIEHPRRSVAMHMFGHFPWGEWAETEVSGWFGIAFFQGNAAPHEMSPKPTCFLFRGRSHKHRPIPPDPAWIGRQSLSDYRIVPRTGSAATTLPRRFRRLTPAPIAEWLVANAELAGSVG